jgi:Na+-driven multidrug efflux pump
MSLVDSICVGQYGSTLELAALGPNLVIFNFVTFSFSFLAIGTTLRVSSALAANNAKQASDTVATALLISVISGALLVAFMVVFAQPTLAATGAVPELLPVAAGYLAVRIWACPAVLATTVLQSGLLAQRDSFTCLLAVLISAAVNVVGDIWLICQMKMGLVGAAWATAVGNYVSLAVLWGLGYTSWGEALRDKWGGGGGGWGGEGKANGSEGLRVKWHWPTSSEMASFNEALGPLFFIALCKNICYLMLQSVSTTFSTVTCAAHQAMWSVWAICSFCPTPLEQAAQVLLPRHVREDTARASQKGHGAMPAGFRASREFVKCLGLVGMVTGLLLGTITAVVARHPHWLTPDPALYGMPVSVSLFCSLTGLFLGLF